MNNPAIAEKLTGAESSDPLTSTPAADPVARFIRLGGLVGVTVAAVVIPLVVPDSRMTFLLNMVLAAIVVTGLSLLMGYAGQVSLGQGAFLAVGALTVALLTTKTSVPPLVALASAPVVAAAFAVVVGVPLLRLRGHFLAFGTLAMLLIVTAAMNTFDVLGGPIGIAGIPPLGIGEYTVPDQRTYVYIALGCLALVLLITHRVIDSRFGRGIRALAGSESAAASAGVALMPSKLAVFALSAAFAGLAGAITVFFTPFVSPESFLALASFGYVVMAVIGGLGTLWGGVVGAVLVSLMIEGLNSLSSMDGMSPTAAPILQYGTYAVVLILALLFLPGGVFPAVRDWFIGRVRAARQPRAKAEAPVAGN